MEVYMYIVLGTVVCHVTNVLYLDLDVRQSRIQPLHPRGEKSIW